MKTHLHIGLLLAILNLISSLELGAQSFTPFPVGSGQTYGALLPTPSISGDKFFFRAPHNTQGLELWVSDGNAANTRVVKDIFPSSGSSGPEGLKAFQNGVLFYADDGLTGREPYFSDGTAAGTVRLADTDPGASGAMAMPFAVVGNKAYFVSSTTGTAQGLWVTDGTVAGTQKLNSTSRSVVKLGSVLLMTRGFTDSLFILNPTTMAASYIASNGNLPAESDVERYVQKGDTLLASVGVANTYALMFTNGTAAGTTLVSTVNGEIFRGMGAPVVYRGHFYFSLSTTEHGTELYSSDGTAAGTQLVQEINPRNNNRDDANPSLLTVSNGKLYFTADNGFYGQELYEYDGTTATRLFDMVQGQGGPQIRFLYDYDGVLHFNSITPAYQGNLLDNGVLGSYRPYLKYSVVGPPRGLFQFGRYRLGITNSSAMLTQQDSLAVVERNGRYRMIGVPVAGRVFLQDLSTAFVCNGRLFSHQPSNVLFPSGFAYLDTATLMATRPAQAEAFTLYPNPASTVVHLRATRPVDEVQLTDAQGKAYLVTAGLRLPVEALPAGLYLVRVRQQGRWHQARFVKQ